MRIPQYNPQTRPTSQALIGPSGAGATAEAFGAGIGRGLQNVAAGVSMVNEVVTAQDLAKRRTADLRKFSAFQTRVNDTMTKMSQSHDPGVGNFSDIARATYAQMEQEFINNEIDPEFREEFSVRTGEMGVGIASKTLEFQLTSNDKWFRDQLNDELESSRISLNQNPTRENAIGLITKMEEMLSASGLSPAEQEMQARTYRKALGVILYKNAQAERLLTEDEGESAIATAAAVIGNFVGGTEEEQTVLAREGEQLAVQSIGNLDLWSAMPARARAALGSLASDLGELPPEIVAAVRSGDLQVLSDSIRELGGERRTQEADLVLDPGAQLDDDPIFDDVPYEDRLALLQDAKVQANAQAAAAAKAATAQDEAMLNALKVDLFDGNAGQMEIDSVRELMGDRLKYEDLNQLQSIYDKRNADLKLTLQGQQMLASQTPFNPISDDDRKILNAMLGTQGIKALQSRDGNYTAQTLIPLVRQSRDIPTDAIGTLMGMIRSNNQESALWALDALAQLEQASPRAFEQRTDEPTASAMELWRTRKDFYPPEQLLSLINGGLTTAERQQTRMLREEAQGLLKDAKLNIKLDIPTLFQTGFFGQNASPSSSAYAETLLTADFNRLFEDQYALYGDVDTAKEKATTLLKKVWGPTQVGANGKVMKYPPEKFYPLVAGSSDWMQNQLKSEGIIQDGEGFELIADAKTEQEVDAFRRGGPPVSYQVVRIVDGRPELVMDGGANVDAFGNVVEVTPLRPRRQYFNLTAIEQADEAAWREEQNSLFTQADLQRALGLAAEHSLETGIPIPEDSEGMGLRDYMMQDNPALEQEKMDDVRKFLFGDPDAPRITIGTQSRN